jgi:ABC-type polar amino acid transport system ATPase subunit
MNAQAAASEAQPVVRAEGVRKSFGENVVLDGIDLSVAAGETLVVIGPSGSGKSTLLRCINLLEPVDSGRIWLEGAEITGKGVKVAQVRQRIGIVFQQFNLFPHLTAIDNVTLAARRVRHMSRREAESRALELLTRVGLREKAEQHPHQLSGGQQQRVAIARSIVSDPNLLLCDEPTGDLDRTSADEILSILQLLNKDLGKTIVMVTHDPAAARYARRIWHLDKGRFIEKDLAA